MRKLGIVVGALFIASTMMGCSYIGSDVNLGAAATAVGVSNITTGDGTFANYKAMDHQSGLEIGIAVGLPLLFKFMELYPVQSNQAMVEEMATRSKANGANAMINVSPPTESYWGFPFGIVGIYIDKVSGTGINVR
jgi:hypothetical protein